MSKTSGPNSPHHLPTSRGRQRGAEQFRASPASSQPGAPPPEAPPPDRAPPVQPAAGWRSRPAQRRHRTSRQREDEDNDQRLKPDQTHDHRLRAVAGPAAVHDPRSRRRAPRRTYDRLRVDRIRRTQAHPHRPKLPYLTRRTRAIRRQAGLPRISTDTGRRHSPGRTIPTEPPSGQDRQTESPTARRRVNRLPAVGRSAHDQRADEGIHGAAGRSPLSRQATGGRWRGDVSMGIRGRASVIAGTCRPLCAPMS